MWSHPENSAQSVKQQIPHLLWSIYATPVLGSRIKLHSNTVLKHLIIVTNMWDYHTFPRYEWFMKNEKEEKTKMARKTSDVWWASSWPVPKLHHLLNLMLDVLTLLVSIRESSSCSVRSCKKIAIATPHLITPSTQRVCLMLTIHKAVNDRHHWSNN